MTMREPFRSPFKSVGFTTHYKGKRKKGCPHGVKRRMLFINKDLLYTKTPKTNKNQLEKITKSLRIDIRQKIQHILITIRNGTCCKANTLRLAYLGCMR